MTTLTRTTISTGTTKATIMVTPTIMVTAIPTASAGTTMDR
ncbi:hypothetical protein [Brevundimonas sp.]|nr:hypothetical protein [Brevundimonas sp.]